MGSHACRSCAGQSGRMVLDLGNQPACDHFPAYDDRDADPTYPLQMWLCSTCGLAQLLGEPIVAEEPLGTEPEALVAQAVDAVERLAATGWLSGRSRVVEFPSPHGGLVARPVERPGPGPRSPTAEPGDLVIDSFGMMHEPDQASALAERMARVAPGGVLLLQYHSLDTIIRLGQWNALRHGHFAYYSTSALAGMLEANGFNPETAWLFELYGGTILLAACRESDVRRADGRLGDGAPVGRQARGAFGIQRRSGACRVRRRPMPGVSATGSSRSSTTEEPSWATAPPRVRSRSCAKREWIAGCCRRSSTRRRQSTDSACRGRTFPSSARPRSPHPGPHDVLLFVPDLLTEVRRTFPEVEGAAGRWVDAEALRG